jgi:glycosyltransferase involved in cell wall biosynthesis
MQLGVVIAGDPWLFFEEIYEDLRSRYSVSLFEHRRFNIPIFYTRINRYLFHHGLETFLANQDVVFFEWASELLIAATRLPKKAKIVTRLHRYEMFEWASKVNWANVDRVILVSHAMQKKFSERFPDHAHKSVVIHESVSTEKFQPVSKPFNGDIGTLCFLSPRKRVYELVLAFAELVQKRDGLRLHIGGSSNKYGDYTDALYSLVQKLELNDKVIFHGGVSEPWKWYPNIDIFVSNSYSEGLQVAPMEAMASARYCLSHHWDGAEELLPVEHLFLTNAEMHAKILAYCDLPEPEKRCEQEKMRSIAIEKFDIGRIKSQIRDVIEDAAREAVVSARNGRFANR